MTTASISYAFPAKGRCKKCGGSASDFYAAKIQLDGLSEEPDKTVPLLQADWMANSSQGTSEKLKDKILRHIPFNDYNPRLHRTVRGNERYQASWQSTDYFRCGNCSTLYWAVRDDNFMNLLTKGKYYH